MEINGIPVDVDVETYLSGHGLHRLRRVGDNIMACCPFHDETSPSFGVNVHNGAYNCFGCGSSGSFVALVAHLDAFDTVFDAQQYLMSVYGRYSTNTDQPIQLNFPVDTVSVRHQIDESVLTQYRYRHPYLERRGIGPKWQDLFGVGYSAEKRAVTFPYRDHRGRLQSVKFRSVDTKAFWYSPPMQKRVKAQMLYGLDKVIRWGISRVAITEAEIDCLSVWQAEIIGCVALGGNHMTAEQSQLLVNILAPDTEFVVFTDNDAGGELAHGSVIERLEGRFRISRVDWSLVNPTYVDADGCEKPVKDANDLSVADIRKLLQPTHTRTNGLKLQFH